MTRATQWAIMRESASLVLACACIAWIVLRVAGCAATRQEQAHAAQLACGVAQVVTYDTELGECVEQGREAGTYVVYELCAQQADNRFRYAHTLCGRLDGGR